jgi:hypothetical protein
MSSARGGRSAVNTLLRSLSRPSHCASCAIPALQLRAASDVAALRHVLQHWVPRGLQSVMAGLQGAASAGSSGACQLGRTCASLHMPWQGGALCACCCGQAWQ